MPCLRLLIFGASHDRQELPVVVVYIMEAMTGADGSFTSALLFAIVLLLVSAAIITQLQDPPLRLPQ